MTTTPAQKLLDFEDTHLEPGEASPGALRGRGQCPPGHPGVPLWCRLSSADAADAADTANAVHTDRPLEAHTRSDTQSALWRACTTGPPATTPTV